MVRLYCDTPSPQRLCQFLPFSSPISDHTSIGPAKLGGIKVWGDLTGVFNTLILREAFRGNSTASPDLDRREPLQSKILLLSYFLTVTSLWSSHKCHLSRKWENNQSSSVKRQGDPDIHLLIFLQQVPDLEHASCKHFQQLAIGSNIQLYDVVTNQ